MLLPPDDQGRMPAALNLGRFGVKVHASVDAGASWQEVAAPTYPAQPAQPAHPTGVPWKLVLVWALESTGGTVWAAAGRQLRRRLGHARRRRCLAVAG